MTGQVPCLCYYRQERIRKTNTLFRDTMSDPVKEVLESGSRIYLECRIEDLERRVAKMEAQDSAQSCALQAAEELSSCKVVEELQKELTALKKENAALREAQRDLSEDLRTWRARYDRERDRALTIYDALARLPPSWARAGESTAIPVRDLKAVLGLFAPLWLAGSY